MPPLFTVLRPIVRPPAFLPSAIETVFGQTVGEFEPMVLSVGAPAETGGYHQRRALAGRTD